MTKDELYLLCKRKGNTYCNEKIFSLHFSQFYLEILNLHFPKDFKFSQKLYHYFNNDYNLSLGICPICGNRCHYKNLNEGYHTYCSLRCRSNDVNLKEKERKTCIEKYGVDNIFKSKEFKEKLKHHNIEKYGCEHFVQSNEFKEKSKETCKNLYGSEFYVQSNIYKSKANNIQTKISETCIKKYGVKNYSKSKEYKKNLPKILQKSKETSLEKYGVERYSQTKEWRERLIKTYNNNYGVNWYTQTSEYHKKKKHKYFSTKTNETYDSSWEMMIAEYCMDNNIKYIYQPNISFEYEYDGKKHIYQPDFIINNKLYEIKGIHFFENHNPNGKMICPFNRNKYTDGIAEAKHQCMIKNNVIIITDIDNFKEMIS